MNRKLTIGTIVASVAAAAAIAIPASASAAATAYTGDLADPHGAITFTAKHNAAGTFRAVRDLAIDQATLTEQVPNACPATASVSPGDLGKIKVNPDRTFSTLEALYSSNGLAYSISLDGKFNKKGIAKGTVRLFWAQNGSLLCDTGPLAFKATP
jgi:hypothetical protein